MPTEPLSTPVGHTAELTCSYSTSVGDNFALEWSFVQPGKPISSSRPVSREQLLRVEGGGWRSCECSEWQGFSMLGWKVKWVAPRCPQGGPISPGSLSSSPIGASGFCN